MGLDEHTQDDEGGWYSAAEYRRTCEVLACELARIASRLASLEAVERAARRVCSDRSHWPIVKADDLLALAAALAGTADTPTRPEEGSGEGPMLSSGSVGVSDLIPGPDLGACPRCGKWLKAGFIHDCPPAASPVSEEHT